MKTVVLFASLLLSAPMALADQNSDINADDQTVELEDGAMSPEAAAALTPPMMHSTRRDDRGAEFVGNLIGIIGAVAADSFDRGHGPGGPDGGWGGGGPGHGGPGHGGPGGGGHGGGDHGGPGHGGPGGGHGGGGHGGGGWGGGDDGGWDRDFVCYARDARGNVYRAAGPNPRRVQDRAVEKCQRFARFCRPQGCHRV